MGRHPSIGEMNARVEILGKTEIDVDGSEGMIDEVKRTVWAAIRPVTGSQEQYFAGQSETRDTYIVSIRWPVGIPITIATRLRNKYEVHGEKLERVFTIVRVIDRDNKHQFLDMRCEVEGSES